MNFQYQPGNSFMHQVDPLNKLAWMICISVLVFIYQDTVSHLLIFGAVLLVALLLARLKLSFIFRSIWILLLFSLGFFVLQVFFIPGSELLFSVGPIAIYKESVDFATAITFRIITVFLSSMVFVVTTDPRDLVLTLTKQLKVPYRIAYSLSIALRFIPTLESEAKVIETAQVIRGVGRQKGLKHKVANFKRFTMPLMMNAIRRVHTTAITMEARGYGAFAERTYTRELTINKGSLVFSWASAAITISLVAMKFI